MGRNVLRVLLLVAVGVLPARGDVRVVAASGVPSPLGLPFSAFGGVGIDATGRVAFVGTSTGLFRRGPDGVRGVLVAGGTLPDGRTIAGVGVPAQGAAGCVAARVFDTDGGDEIVRACPVGMVRVAAAGEAAPGGGAYARFGDVVALGVDGHVAFRGLLTDGGEGVFRWRDGNLETIAWAGTPTPSGGTFADFRVAGVTATGRVGFRAAVSNGSDGLFVGDGATVGAVVVNGQASPAGGQFRAIGNASLGAEDLWAFRADISEGGRSGIFRADGRGALPSVAAVALSDDPVPGDDARFRAFSASVVPAIADDGRIAFRASIAGVSGGAGVFVATSAGALEKVVVSRESTAVGALVRFRDPAIATDGSVVFPAAFAAGGSGIFVARLGVVSQLAGLEDASDLPGTGGRFRFAEPSPRDTAEDAVFRGFLDGVFVTEASGLRTVAALGGAAPLGGVFAGFGPVAISEGGDVAFLAEVGEGGPAEMVVRAAVGDPPRAVAATGARAGRRGIFANFVSGTVTAAGRPDIARRSVAVEALLDNGPAASGLFVLGPRKRRAIAFEGRTAPGGGTYAAFGDPAVAGGGRTVAFVAALRDGRQGVYRRRGQRVRRVARTGELAGERLGGRFVGFDAVDALGGAVAFRGLVDQGAGQGIFVARGARSGALATTTDVRAGLAFRGVSAPTFAGDRLAFLGRLPGAAADGLYVGSAAVPDSAALPPIAALLVPGNATPVGGTVSGVGAPAGADSGAIGVVIDVAGGTAQSAVVVVTP